MNGRYLLDTNIIIALLAGDRAVLNYLAVAEEVFMPSAAIGELYYGAFKSSRVQENLTRIDELSSVGSVLPCDELTASLYGRIKYILREKGRPIPENDIWIGATALQHDLKLVSRDAHFGEIDGLILEAWR